MLPLLADHGARLVYRGRRRNDDAAQPFEVHVLWFPDRAALDAYLADDRRRALLDEFGEVFTSKQVVEMQTIASDAAAMTIDGARRGGGRSDGHARDLQRAHRLDHGGVDGTAAVPRGTPGLVRRAAAARLSHARRGRRRRGRGHDELRRLSRQHALAGIPVHGRALDPRPRRPPRRRARADAPGGADRAGAAQRHPRDGRRASTPTTATRSASTSGSASSRSPGCPRSATSSVAGSTSC